MSVLNKMKSINTQKTVQLVTWHVLATKDTKLRLQYLACVAMAMALERGPNSSEHLAFNDLAASLNIDAAVATEQLNERANVSEEDMLGLFETLKAKKLAWIYLLDVAMLHAVDGEIDAHEIEFMEAVAPMLEVQNTQQAVALQGFALAVSQKKALEAARLMVQLPQDKALQAMLPQVVKGCFQFAGLLHGRWIVHGDGTVTDITSGLVWAVNPVNVVNPNKSADFPPNPVKRMSSSDAMSWPKYVNEKGWCGYQDWRLPTVDELKTLLLPGDHRPKRQNLHIRVDVFSDIPPKDYIVWTSPPNGSDNWLVDFSAGNASSNYYHKDTSYFVRVVRSGQ
jgi:hypothetical protein